jgi:hypothetical protein
MFATPQSQQIQTWPIDRLVFYARNPRKNDAVVDRTWDEELLALELQALNAEDFDLSLTGFNPGEIDGLLAIPDEELANATPPVPEIPVSRAGDLWLCGEHRVLCGDSLCGEDVAQHRRLRSIALSAR